MLIPIWGRAQNEKKKQQQKQTGKQMSSIAEGMDKKINVFSTPWCEKSGHIEGEKNPQKLLDFNLIVESMWIQFNLTKFFFK